MDGGSFQRLDVDPERTSWMQHGEPPVEVAVSDEQPSVTLTTRETIDVWLEAGWATPDTPDWLSGGYVTKERAQTALRMLADQIDALSARLVAVEQVAFPPIITIPTQDLLTSYIERATPCNVHPEVPTTPAKGKKA